MHWVDETAREVGDPPLTRAASHSVRERARTHGEQVLVRSGLHGGSVLAAERESRPVIDPNRWRPEDE